MDLEQDAPKMLEDSAKLAACLVHRANELCSARPAVIFIGLELALVQFVKNFINEKKAADLHAAISKVMQVDFPSC